MTIAEWQLLSPGEAARRVHEHVRRRLSAAQRQAAISWLPDERALATAFDAAPRDRDHPLGGVPFFAKDLFDVRGAPTFAGSTFLPEVRTAIDDSTLIHAARAAGLVCAGKTHLHEFAYGITGENPHYGDCEHPAFPGRTTGGSSSGSAAVVAAGVVPVALGTDTGGSVRVPAAFCGLYGFRQTPRDAWIRDAFPLAPSFDTAGWFTRNAAAMRAMLGALVGVRQTHRPLHGCSVELPGLEAETATTFRAAAERFAPFADEATADDLRAGFAPALEAYNTTVAAEAWRIHAPWAERFRDRYDPNVWQRLNRAHALTTAELDAAARTVAAVRVLWAKFFLTYDFLVLPATPFGALTKADCNLENRTRLLRLTAPASLGGLPVLTVPFALPSGLTSGLQIVVNQPHSPVLLPVLARAEEQPLGVAA